MRDSNRRALKVGCVEIPLGLSESGGELAVVPGQTPPLQLLSFAAAAEETGCEVELIPSDVWWPAQPSSIVAELYARGAERILSRLPDVIVLVANGLSWPVATRLLAALARASGESRPRVVVGGAHSPALLQAISERETADAFFCAGQEEAFKRFLSGSPEISFGSASHRASSHPRAAIPDALECERAARSNRALASSVAQLSKWPRWEKGLSNAETYGFPLDNQPHPWNLPAVSGPTLTETEEWLQGVLPSLRTLREPSLWLSMANGLCTQEAMECLGEFALRALKEYGISPVFGIRVTVDELLAPYVLASLAMFQVSRVDLLTGSGADSSLQRYHAQYTTPQIEECVREVKRAGLAAKTRLLNVIGMPGEDVNEALETVRFAARLAAETSISEIKSEWWCNVPGSAFYQPTPAWEELLHHEDKLWLVDERLLSQAPSAMASEHRKVLKDTLDFLRILSANPRISGPSLF